MLAADFAPVTALAFGIEINDDGKGQAPRQARAAEATVRFTFAKGKKVKKRLLIFVSCSAALAASLWLLLGKSQLSYRIRGYECADFDSFFVALKLPDGSKVESDKRVSANYNFPGLILVVTNEAHNSQYPLAYCVMRKREDYMDLDYIVSDRRGGNITDVIEDSVGKDYYLAKFKQKYFDSPSYLLQKTFLMQNVILTICSEWDGESEAPSNVNSIIESSHAMAHSPLFVN